MSYLDRLKGRLAQQADTPADPFEGFEGARGGRVSPDLPAAVPKFLAEEEERLKNQFFSQKKPPQDGGQLVQITGEIRLPDEPSKPSKGSGGSIETGPELWRGRFHNLSGLVASCPGFRDREWPRVFEAVHAFLERHAAQADALGWTALELFGVHPVVGAARVDCCGALMVSAGKHVVAVERDAIAFAHGRFSRRPWQPVSVLLWSFDNRSSSSSSAQLAPSHPHLGAIP